MEENNANRIKSIPNKHLKKAREERGWTHKEIADLLDLPDSRMFSRWEHGLHMPRPHYRRRLAELFGKSMEELGLLKPEPEEHLQPKEPQEYHSPLAPIWNTPPTFTSLIGREQDIPEACALLQRSNVRLLTFFGPGGIGKTRLAIQIAKEMRAFFPDGTCFVSLAEINDATLVAPTIAETLGIEENGQLSLPEQIKAMLTEKHLLLVLDSFEHITQAALFLEELLAACSEIKVLVTSRSILHISAEHIFSVPPLALPDQMYYTEPARLLQFASTALFVDRAQAVKSTFQVTSENLHVITKVCSHLDGLPLAIELAAARINLLPPQAMLSRLTQKLQFLKSDLRTLPERHRTLYNTIAWSYDLLTPQEQLFFRRLSIFTGGCTIESIATVYNEQRELEIDILPLLSSLLDKSLLQQNKSEADEPRFAFLESVRDYGLERLREHNELEECQQAHARYYLALVEEALPHLNGPDMAMWLTQLDEEKENLRAALSWLLKKNETELALRFCEGFGKFCGLRGYWTEEWRWLQAVLELPTTATSRNLRARILRRAGHLAYRLRNLTMARAWQEESIELSRESGDQQTLAGSLSGLGWTLYRQNKVELTEQLLHQSVEAALTSGSTWVLANALDSLGRFMHYQSRSEEARPLLEKSIELTRELADKESLSRILTSLIAVELTQGNPTQATILAQESFALAQELGNKPLIALTLDSLVDIAMFQGEYEKAADLLEKRLLQAEEIGDIPTLAQKRLMLGDIDLIGNDVVQAESRVQQSLVFFQHQGDVPNISVALGILANIRRMQGKLSEASNLYQQSLQFDQQSGQKRNMGKHLIGLAKVVLDQENYEEATFLLGMAESCLNPQTDLHAAQRIDYSHTKEFLHRQLNEPIFADQWNKGHSTAFEQTLIASKLSQK